MLFFQVSHNEEMTYFNSQILAVIIWIKLWHLVISRAWGKFSLKIIYFYPVREAILQILLFLLFSSGVSNLIPQICGSHAWIEEYNVHYIFIVRNKASEHCIVDTFVDWIVFIKLGKARSGNWVFQRPAWTFNLVFTRSSLNKKPTLLDELILVFGLLVIRSDRG